MALLLWLYDCHFLAYLIQKILIGSEVLSPVVINSFIILSWSVVGMTPLGSPTTVWSVVSAPDDA
jgi:hypothetical protein